MKKEEKKELGFLDIAQISAGEVILLVLLCSSGALFYNTLGLRWLPGEIASATSFISIIFLGMVFAVCTIGYFITAKKRRKMQNSLKHPSPSKD